MAHTPSHFHISDNTGKPFLQKGHPFLSLFYAQLLVSQNCSELNLPVKFSWSWPVDSNLIAEAQRDMKIVYYTRKTNENIQIGLKKMTLNWQERSTNGSDVKTQNCSASSVRFISNKIKHRLVQGGLFYLGWFEIQPLLVLTVNCILFMNNIRSIFWEINL